jgi:hypothetical protein
VKLPDDICFVLFPRGAPRAWAAAAKVLAAASPRIALADATRACRFGEGLVPVALPAAEATRAAAALRDAGFPAAAWPRSELELSPPAWLILDADAYADGFHVQVDLRGSMRTLPWDDLRVVDVVRVVPEHVVPRVRWLSPLRVRPPAWDLERRAPRLTREDLVEIGKAIGLELASYALEWATGLPLDAIALAGRALRERPEPESLETPPPTPRPPPRPETWLELHTADLRLRVRSDAFRYDYLGRRRALASRVNFRRLVDDVTTFAPHAMRAGRTEATLRGRPDSDVDPLAEALHEARAVALRTRVARFGRER